ncbi:MAG: lysophospholipid acyltransferase family protein [Clostridiaceae bacterium]
MISPTMAKFLNMIPDGLLVIIIKKYIASVLKKYADIEINGIEKARNVKGPIIFISNHLSNSDGLVLSKALKEFDPTFVAGVKLAKNKFTNLGVLIVKTTPIRPDSADKEGLTKIINITKQGGNILMFPEGTRSRTGKLIKAKKGLFLISKLTKATIIPLGVAGTDKFMPINDKGMEFEKFHHAKITINFGDPITLRPKGKDEDKKEYEDNFVNECMYKIASLLPEEYRGEYSNLE